MLAFVLVSAVLMVLDQRFNVLQPGRLVLADASYPLYQIVRFPARVVDWFAAVFVDREVLLKENQRLKEELLVLRSRTQRLAGMAAENERFRELLNSTALVDENILVAEIVGVSPDVTRQTVVIDKGEQDGIREGLAVIDAYGLVGQIVEVASYGSRVLMITDETHSVPAELVRNGVRVVVEGTGRLDMLEINHVAATMDVRPGDLLVSSGLGGRFPEGYPVGIIDSVQQDPGLPFAVVVARPSAHIDRGRHLLVVMRAPDPIPAIESVVAEPRP